MIQFLKNWTLPIAMCAGAIGYFLFTSIPWLHPLRPIVDSTTSLLTPILIFVMLFLTFCKVSFKELKPRRWHAWLLLIQLSISTLLACFLICFPSFSYKVEIEAAMVCFICPTATAAAVITAKLGGNASSLTTYTIFSNLLAALIVPILFPLVEPHTDSDFNIAFQLILSKVFPLLILPFMTALIIRRFCPTLLRIIMGFRDLAFYLWAVALAIVVAQTIRSIVHSEANTVTLITIATAGMIACGIQFFLGKRIGGHYRDRISGGQALGQKNTVFAIWLAYTYLTPLSSLGPGSYVLWQNIINSWQLWRKRKVGASK